MLGFKMLFFIFLRLYYLDVVFIFRRKLDLSKDLKMFLNLILKRYLK